MRRTYIVALLALCAVAAEAQPFDPFQPENPVVMGRGGSFTATATGYNSFFYNPAGFARGGELTLAATNVWAFMDRDLISFAQDIAEGTLGIPLSLSTASVSPASASVAPRANVSARALDPATVDELGDSFTALEEWATNEDPAVIQDIVEEAAGGSDVQYEPGDDFADILASADTQDIQQFLEDFEAAAEARSPTYPAGTLAGVLDQIQSALPGGFLRTGAQAGLGYVGNGIGLGLFANVEATVNGENILEAYGTAYNTITFVGGLGLTFGGLNLGISVRPTVFGYTRVNAAPILSSYLTGETIDFTSMFQNTVYYGSGLGVDVGALWELGPLSMGIAVKDLLGTQIGYRRSDFDSYFQALQQASLPVGSALTPEELASAWTIPMKVNAGIEFHPDLGVLSYLIDPSVSVDLLDMTSAVRTWQAGEQVSTEQIVDMLNFGGELRLLQFLALRGGYYGGYLSGGVGLDIFLLDINAAIAGDFGRDASGQWGFGNVGGSLEVAIRF